MAESVNGASVLDDLTTKDKRQCIETLIKILRNTVQSDDPKYRKLRVTNTRFRNEIWRHDGGQSILLSAGWSLDDDGETLVLPSDADVTLTLATLLDNREVIPDEKEWVEETKLIVQNPEKALEDILRQKALAEKAREMANLKKDMAERKAISNRILAEHKNDRNIRATQPAVARPLGEGGSSNMKEITPKDGGG